MQIRKATFADIPEMIDLGKRGHSLSENRHLEFDEPGAKLFGAQCMSSNGLCAFVAEDEGRIIGLLLGQEQQWPYLKAKLATDCVFFAERCDAFRALMHAFEAWAFDERKVDQIVMGVTFGGNSSAPLYKRMGFAQTGGTFIKNRGG